MAYNVLIVDDSRSMRKVIIKTLHLSGFAVGECIEAGNGREALELLDNHWIDLILSDIHMPEMDGFALLRALRERGISADLPIVFITTEWDEARLKEAVALGAKGYIRKPFRPEEIRALLAQIMGETDGFRVEAGDEGCDF